MFLIHALHSVPPVTDASMIARHPTPLRIFVTWHHVGVAPLVFEGQAASHTAFTAVDWEAQNRATEPMLSPKFGQTIIMRTLDAAVRQARQAMEIFSLSRVQRRSSARC